MKIENFSGKSTTFKMMTRDITMSNGEIYFNGNCCNKAKNEVSTRKAKTFSKRFNHRINLPMCLGGQCFRILSASGRSEWFHDSARKSEIYGSSAWPRSQSHWQRSESDHRENRFNQICWCSGERILRWYETEAEHCTGDGLYSDCVTCSANGKTKTKNSIPQ